MILSSGSGCRCCRRKFRNGRPRQVENMITRNTILITVVAAIMATLLGCTNGAEANKTQPGLVGADRDAHGCIGSAGYSWCARAAACVRPWELAHEKGFENSAEAYRKYCSGVSE